MEGDVTLTMWSAEFIRALARAAGGPTIKLFRRILVKPYEEEQSEDICC